MTIHQFIYVTHVTAAISAFILGGIAMLVPKSKGYHTKVGETYFWVILYAMITAFYLAAKDESVIFMIIALATLYWALTGYIAAKQRKVYPLTWKKKHLINVSASYMACWTALAVKGFPGPVLLHWIWPAIIGTILLRRFMKRKAIA